MSNKIFHFLILAYATIFAQGCSFLEDFIDDEEHNETIETEYKLSTSDINGYDQMIYSDRVCHLYKANDNNLPHSITSFITDENNELHIIHYSFDDNGIPNYIIFDNQSIYLDNINGTTYDMTVINPDGTFFTLDNIDTGIDIASYWDNISTLTKAEPGMSYPEYAFALTKHLFGGVAMAQGGVMMLMGCAMLVPGANVAVGATLMLTGGAQFLAGALLTTRATDQIVSDGSHTEGFDQMASGLSLSSAMGGLTTAGTKISSEICKVIITAVFEAGYDGTERFLREHRAECDESKEKVKDFLKEALITGDVNFLNLDSREVELSGSMTRLLSSSDRVGILLSSDTDAMYVDDYKDIDNFTSGDFKATFSDLWRDQYYYRAFYESKEYNRTFIASAKSFTFPRVETLHYDILDDNKYKIHYRVDADPAHLPTETGICLSDTEYEPTIDDISKSITISESCEESIEFTLEEPFYYYRAYVKIGDKYIYGDTHELTGDERENGGSGGNNDGDGDGENGGDAEGGGEGNGNGGDGDNEEDGDNAMNNYDGTYLLTVLGSASKHFPIGKTYYIQVTNGICDYISDKTVIRHETEQLSNGRTHEYDESKYCQIECWEGEFLITFTHYITDKVYDLRKDEEGYEYYNFYRYIEEEYYAEFTFSAISGTYEATESGYWTHDYSMNPIEVTKCQYDVQIQLEKIQ